MHDIKKLPKWAQDRIREAESEKHLTGASVSGVTVENVGVKHTKHTANALDSICKALISNSQANIENAKAIMELAKSLNGGGVECQFGNGINISNVSAK